MRATVEVKVFHLPICHPKWLSSGNAIATEIIGPMDWVGHPVLAGWPSTRTSSVRPWWAPSIYMVVLKHYWFVSIYVYSHLVCSLFCACACSFWFFATVHTRTCLDALLPLLTLVRHSIVAWLLPSFLIKCSWQLLLLFLLSFSPFPFCFLVRVARVRSLWTSTAWPRWRGW